jgi:hypothetical protein
LGVLAHLVSVQTNFFDGVRPFKNLLRSFINQADKTPQNKIEKRNNEKRCERKDSQALKNKNKRA